MLLQIILCALLVCVLSMEVIIDSIPIANELVAIMDVTPQLRAIPNSWSYHADDFRRRDESNDSNFYKEPRLVYHIDEGAVTALTKYYERTFTHGKTHLDICSSWVSHYPTSVSMHRSIGLGMNEYELSQNKQLTDYIVQDLNVDPSIPLESNSVDVVTCVVSIDYLINPIEVLREVHRVLKPGGVFIISQSNRCFPSKAIKMWLDTDDMEHLSIIRDYFHFAGGFKKIRALDISGLAECSRSHCDPMFIVQGIKE